MFAAKGQDNGGAGSHSLTHHLGALTRWMRRVATGVVGVAVVTFPLSGAVAAQEATTPKFSKLTLLHGWVSYGNGTAGAAVARIDGIIHLKGGIKTKGNNPVPFTLPAADRPVHKVFVPIDLCNGDSGRLDITPAGVVTVEAEAANWANAQCFTSLDGVTFAQNPSSFTPLILKNGWTSYGLGTASPAARKISGIVHLQGAMKTDGANQLAFVLPPGDRPTLRVFVPIDLCGVNNGDLFIQADGSVDVEAQGGTWSNAQCFTSLDGVSFAPKASSFKPLILQNAWTSTGLASARPAVRVISGIVQLEGDMYTNGVNPVPFTLPAGFRPSHNVAIKVALCGEDSGELVVGARWCCTTLPGGSQMISLSY